MAAAAVAAITAGNYGLRELVPVVSTGVVYMLAVLLVSSGWGLWLGLLTALMSAAAFNYFHIPPTGALHDRRRRELGGAGRLPGRRRGDEHPRRRSPAPAPPRPSAAAPRRT